jgi:uncharacterized protein YegL
MRNLLSVFIFAFMTVVLAPPAFAGDAQVIIEANPVEFPLIKVIANIRTPEGEPIGGVKMGDVEIQEDGFKAAIKSLKEKASDAVEPIDVVFVFDTTGSMGEEIKAVRDNIVDFANVLEKTNMDYRLGLVTFGDKVREVHEPMADVAKFKTLIGKQKADGGGDTPENALDAIHKMTKFDFRKGAKIVGIVITDAPYHSANKVTKLHTLPVLKQVREKGIVLYTLAPQGHRYIWMAAETGGVWHDVTQDFSALVSQLAASLTAQYVIEMETHKPNADNSKRKVKLVLKGTHTGSATATYRAPSNIEASSFLTEKNRPKDAYHMKNIADGDKRTAWFEASPDDGIGEWLKITFTEAKKVDKIGILGGYPKTDKLFKQNNRIKNMTLILSNGDTQVIKLKDSKEMQYVAVESSAKTSYVKVVINSVYKGSKYRDTCIAELEIK